MTNTVENILLPQIANFTQKDWVCVNNMQQHFITILLKLYFYAEIN